MEAMGAVREGAGQLRLMWLLEGFVGERGRTEATKGPGGNYKTLAEAPDSGRITPRLRDALDRLLSPGEGAAQAEARQETQGAAGGSKAAKRRSEGPTASLPLILTVEPADHSPP